MSKHTPAPLAFYQCGLDRYKGWFICRDIPFQMRQPETLRDCVAKYLTKGDAVLFSAAPEMLSALKQILSPLPNDSTCVAELNRRTSLIEAAIAKAEGK